MKNFLLFLPVFIWLQACSQSPAPTATEQQAHPILFDTSGAALGDSPSREYRLFKFIRKTDEKSEMVLKVLRLKDLQEALVATLPAEDEFKTGSTYPKFYWSKESTFLITENNVPDSIYKRETVFFDLAKFNVGSRRQGNLLNFDLVNDIVFTYGHEADRQIIYFFDINTPDKVKQREVLAPPSGHMPVVLLAPLEKKTKVKAYMPDGVPVNFSFLY